MGSKISFPKLRIWQKLCIGVGGLFLVVLICAGYFISSFLKDTIRSDVQRKLADINRSAVSIIEQDVDAAMHIDALKIKFKGLQKETDCKLFVLNSICYTVYHPELGKDVPFSIKDKTGRDMGKEICRQKSGSMVIAWQDQKKKIVRQKMVQFVHIPQYDWVVVTETDLDIWHKPVYRLYRLLFSIGLVSLILILIITRMIGVNLGRKILMMKKKLVSFSQQDIIFYESEPKGDEASQFLKDMDLILEKLDLFLNALKTENQTRRTMEQDLARKEKKYRKIFEDAVGGIFIITPEAKIQEVNPFFYKMLGYDSSQDLIDHFTQASQQAFLDSNQLKEFLRRLEKNNIVIGYEIQLYKKDKKAIWVSIDARATRDLDGNIKMIEGFCRDISSKRLAEDALKKQKENLEILSRKRSAELIKSNKMLTNTVKELESRTNEIVSLNKFGDLLQACESDVETYSILSNICRQLFPSDSGYLSIIENSQALLKVVAAWGDIPPRLNEYEFNQCWAIRRGKEHFVLEPETEPVCPHVDLIPNYSYICIPMIAQGEMLGMVHLCMTPGNTFGSESKRKDLIESKRMLLVSIVERYSPCLMNLRLRNTLKVASIRDPLTGLYNRRHMEEALYRETHRVSRKGTSLGIIMIDVDRFKSFNDSYGHEAGDIVLKELGDFINRNIRNDDIACRYGGEEFIIIMSDANLEIVRQRAEQIRSGLKTGLKIKALDYQETVTVSIGVALYPDHGGTSEEVIHAADTALYTAKTNGRDQVVVAEALPSDQGELDAQHLGIHP